MCSFEVALPRRRTIRGSSSQIVMFNSNWTRVLRELPLFECDPCRFQPPKPLPRCTNCFLHPISRLTRPIGEQALRVELPSMFAMPWPMGEFSCLLRLRHKNLPNLRGSRGQGLPPISSCKKNHPDFLKPRAAQDKERLLEFSASGIHVYILCPSRKLWYTLTCFAGGPSLGDCGLPAGRAGISNIAHPSSITRSSPVLYQSHTV